MGIEINVILCLFRKPFKTFANNLAGQAPEKKIANPTTGYLKSFARISLKWAFWIKCFQLIGHSREEGCTQRTIYNAVIIAQT